MLLIYLAAVITAIILQRQERRHHKELVLVYEHLGLPAPPYKPKLPRLECLLNILLGLFLTGGGIFFLWMNFSMVNLTHENSRPTVLPLQWEFSTVTLAAGLSLLVLGFRSLLELRRYERSLAASSTS